MASFCNEEKYEAEYLTLEDNILSNTVAIDDYLRANTAAGLSPLAEIAADSDGTDTETSSNAGTGVTSASSSSTECPVFVRDNIVGLYEYNTTR